MANGYDCAVVGAGSFGVWSALRIRQSGRSVVLIDKFGPGNPKCSSGGETRIMRMAYGRDEIYTRYAFESLSDWKEVFERAGEPDLFRHTGVLWTLGKDHPHGRATQAVFERLGIAYEILSAGELRARFPQFLFAEDSSAIFEPYSGAILARKAVELVTAAAVRAGVKLWAPREITPQSFRQIPADQFVFACGPWLPKIFPDLLGDRIRVTRQPVCYFALPAGRAAEYDSPSMPIWLDFTDEFGGYVFPRLSGSDLKAALDRHGPEFDPDTGSREVAQEETQAIRRFLHGHVPEVADAPVTRTEICQYENTSNGDFLIDRHPEFGNVWLAGGGSGHGFKHGPAVGRYVANLLDGTAMPEPRFSLDRKDTAPRRTVF